MSIETFVTKKFQVATLVIIDQANTIITEYSALGFVLNLRQLYYQFVSRDLIRNKQSEYKRLGNVIKDGRRAGMIDWTAIEDRTRAVRFHTAWDNPADFIKSAACNYAEDPWTSQIYRPEVWIEKDALLGVIEGVCQEWRVPYFACRGNNSETLQYQAGKRFQKHLADGRIPLVLHLGDHDPNGIDMSRDIRKRLAMHARHEVEVRRIALNINQVRRYEPPPNPAKITDSRYRAYVREFGTTDCWELDALNPTVIADLIDAEIESLVDHGTWDRTLANETRHRAILAAASENWSEVENFLTNLEA